MSLLWRNKQLRVGLAADRIYITGAKSVDLAASDGGFWRVAFEMPDERDQRFPQGPAAPA